MARQRSRIPSRLMPASSSSTRSPLSRSSVSATLRRCANSRASTAAPCSSAPRFTSAQALPGSMRAMTPSTSPRNCARATTRSPCCRGRPWLLRAARMSSSRSPGRAFGYGSGLSEPAQAIDVPKRSSMATGSPVSWCTASAMPSGPPLATPMRVRRSWTSKRRWRASRAFSASCIDRSSARLLALSPSTRARSLATAARSWRCRRALISAFPACWASSPSRSCWGLSGSASAATTRKPKAPARLASGYAQVHVTRGSRTRPPARPSAGSCASSRAGSGTAGASGSQAPSRWMAEVRQSQKDGTAAVV